jgi:hypothetical protein
VTSATAATQALQRHHHHGAITAGQAHAPPPLLRGGGAGCSGSAGFRVASSCAFRVSTHTSPIALNSAVAAAVTTATTAGSPHGDGNG